MSRNRLEPFFIETPIGPIFLLLKAPAAAEQCVLFVPPFGEEMNKCRRQLAETAELLVSAGYAALAPDLFGTGDSAGEFVEASWATWRDNVGSAISWGERHGLPVTAVVATRLGCMLAAEALEHAPHAVRRTIFWQPVESGRQFITQFLRLRVAASMLHSDGAETVDELKGRLERGESVDVAGYRLNADLWRTIGVCELSPLLHRRLGHLFICDVGRSPGALSVTAKRMLGTAVEKGLHASAERIVGDPFWSSTEIVTNPNLARQTVNFLVGKVC